jgi:nitrite reductase/ring-hydroxylating ferredoxin subunit
MADGEWKVIEGIDPQSSGFPLAVNVNGEDVVVLQTGGGLRAIQRWCPHQEADLMDGRIMGDMIKCPMHGFIYRLADGRGMNHRGINAQVYEVAAEGSQLKLRKCSP